MSIYRRDDVSPDWEPIPWDLKGDLVDAQERGFAARAKKPIDWLRVPILDFPAEGIFGRDRDWFRKHEIDYHATVDGEDLILWDNTWNGFPDPPRWGLASRPAGAERTDWSEWGHFPDLPPAWRVPGQQELKKHDAQD